jgi:hypothetical protein
MAKKATGVQEPMKIRGMMRLQIEDGPTGKIVGDSGWHENIITNAGFLNIVNQMGTGLTGSKIMAAALGTGGQPVATDTILSGEVLATGANSVIRPALTAATSSTSKTLHNTATFSSANSFASASYNISNVGLWSTTGPVSTSGTLLQGITYTSSALSTNQNVNLSYDLIFS